MFSLSFQWWYMTHYIHGFKKFFFFCPWLIYRFSLYFSKLSSEKSISNLFDTKQQFNLAIMARQQNKKRGKKNSSVLTVLTQLSHDWKTSHNRLKRDSGWQIKATKRKESEQIGDKKKIYNFEKKLQEKKEFKKPIFHVFSVFFFRSQTTRIIGETPRFVE